MASKWLNWCEYSYKYALECHPNNYKGNIRTRIYDFWGESPLNGMAAKPRNDEDDDTMITVSRFMAIKNIFLAYYNICWIVILSYPDLMEPNLDTLAASHIQLG